MPVRIAASVEAVQGANWNQDLENGVILYFKVLYQIRPRRWFSKATITQESHWFMANDLAEAMRLAKEYGEERFRRRKWLILRCDQMGAAPKQLVKL